MWGGLLRTRGGCVWEVLLPKRSIVVFLEASAGRVLSVQKPLLTGSRRCSSAIAGKGPARGPIQRSTTRSYESSGRAEREAAHLPLRGVRVLTLAVNLPGPAAACRLCDMGASVVKVEPPGGDPLARM